MIAIALFLSAAHAAWFHYTAFLRAAHLPCAKMRGMVESDEDPKPDDRRVSGKFPPKKAYCGPSGKNHARAGFFAELDSAGDFSDTP